MSKYVVPWLIVQQANAVAKRVAIRLAEEFRNMDLDPDAAPEVTPAMVRLTLNEAADELDIGLAIEPEEESDTAPETLGEALGGFVETDEEVARAAGKVFRDRTHPPEEITRLRRERDQLRMALERLWAFREIGPSEWAWNEARRILDATTPEEEG